MATKEFFESHYVPRLERVGFDVLSVCEECAEVKFPIVDGSDHIVAIDIKEPAKSAWDLHYGFDIDDYVYCWLKAKRNCTQGVPDAVQLADNGIDVCAGYENLAIELSQIEEDWLGEEAWPESMREDVRP